MLYFTFPRRFRYKQFSSVCAGTTQQLSRTGRGPVVHTSPEVWSIPPPPLYIVTVYSKYCFYVTVYSKYCICVSNVLYLRVQSIATVCPMYCMCPMYCNCVQCIEYVSNVLYLRVQSIATVSNVLQLCPMFSMCSMYCICPMYCNCSMY